MPRRGGDLFCCGHYAGDIARSGANGLAYSSIGGAFAPWNMVDDVDDIFHGLFEDLGPGHGAKLTRLCVTIILQQSRVGSAREKDGSMSDQEGPFGPSQEQSPSTSMPGLEEPVVQDGLDSGAQDGRNNLVMWVIVALVAVAVVIGIAVFFVSRGDDDAAPTETTTTTVSSTTSSTEPSTTTTLDPRQQYVGVTHDDRGAGLPLGVEIRSFGFAKADNGDPKNGDFVYFWTRDEKGDMLWLDAITKASLTASPMQSKTVAVWDLPKVTDEQLLCLGWCYDAKSKNDPTIVALFDVSNKPLKAWRVGTSPASFSPIAATGLRPYAPMDETGGLPIPARPELYGTAALANSQDRVVYNSVEQVSVGGGGTLQGGFLWDVNDFKEGMKVAVLVRDGKVADMAITDYVSTAALSFSSEGSTTPLYKFDGKADADIVAYVTFEGEGEGVGKVHAAWRVDPATHTFSALDASKVTANK